jgi:hypothetical protein
VQRASKDERNEYWAIALKDRRGMKKDETQGSGNCMEIRCSYAFVIREDCVEN